MEVSIDELVEKLTSFFFHATSFRRDFACFSLWLKTDISIGRVIFRYAFMICQIVEQLDNELDMILSMNLFILDVLAYCHYKFPIRCVPKNQFFYGFQVFAN